MMKLFNILLPSQLAQRMDREFLLIFGRVLFVTEFEVVFLLCV